MMKIIRFAIPCEQFRTFIRESKLLAKRFDKECGGLLSMDGKFVSVPMATTSAAYIEAHATLNEFFGYSGAFIEDNTSEFSMVRTNAPEAYDYGYVISVGTTDGSRLLAIPSSRVEYQRGRYSSGLYASTVCV